MNYESLGFTPTADTVKLYTKRLGQAQDYIKYLYGTKPIKTDDINEGTLLDFTLVPDAAGVLEANRPHRGDYIIFETKTYGVWYTGFITNEPELSEYLGAAGGVPVWAYTYKATSDDILLSQNPLGLMTPFLNTTQGGIIRALAEQLAPGRFDLSAVQDGLVVARYAVDPTKSFAQVVKDLAGTANYRFYSKNMQLFYEPLDYRSAAFNIDGTDQYFTPSNLKFNQAQQQIVNDAIVLGDIEPQTFVNEYFISDGATAQYPLISSVFGVDSAVLLDDTFTGSEIDDTKWSVNDTVNGYIQAVNGYLNFLGGNQSGTIDAWIEAADLIPLEGNLRFTHGDWDFLENPRNGVHGIIGGLWKNSPRGADVSQLGSGGGDNCLYGIAEEYEGATGRWMLYPVVGGKWDSTQNPMILDSNFRYTLRTIVTFNNLFRQNQQYSYVSDSGAVNVLGGSASPDTAQFSSIVTAVDPTTGIVMTQVQWTSTLNLDEHTAFALYVPAALNDLHASVTNITVSTPLQASLETLAPGGSSAAEQFWTRQIVGPNEIDAYDGLSPLATIITSNSGITQRSSYLGSPKYNPGNAMLQFFKDSTKQTSTIPVARTLLHLRYRSAGAAMARVVDQASVLAESEQWGDNGHRSVTSSAITPQPRTSAECELAAAAMVAEGKRVHFDGTYTTYSQFISGEPTAGTILKFMNLPTTAFGDPAQLPIPPHDTGETFQPVDDQGNPTGPPQPVIDPGDPNTYNFYEQITSVKSTLLIAKNGNELFQHDLQFGATDRLKTLLSNFNKQTDVFAPEDTAEVPTAIDASVLGEWNVDNVVSPVYSGYDPNFVYFDAGQDLTVDGGFEVRYTDESWGIDDAKNLTSRSSNRVWTVPRTNRGRICFIRAFDKRNQVIWSEDLTNAAWQLSGTISRALEMIANINGNTSLVTKLVMPPNSYVYQNLPNVLVAQNMCAALDIFGAAGLTTSVTLTTTDGLVAVSQAYVTNGLWQRVAVNGTGSSSSTGQVQLQIQNTSSVTQTIYVTRVQLEVARDSETVYCKTLDQPHGAYSRFSAALHVKFPLKPLPPKCSLDVSNITAPALSLTPPDQADDVWGFEIRQWDNTSVMFKENLTDDTYTPKYVNVGNTARQLIYFLYSYNILGEYSDPFILTYVIPQPQVKNLRVDDSDKSLKWDAVGAKGAVVEVWTVGGGYYPMFTYQTAGQILPLPDPVFFPKWLFVVKPYDDIGEGITAQVQHEYIASDLLSFDQDEVTNVAAPPAPATPPTPPSQFVTRSEVYQREAIQNYGVNRIALALE